MLRVAGVDEAGRGPLAGPVIAAAVWFPEAVSHPLIRDSKQLTRAQRTEAAAFIRQTAVWTIASSEVEEIDRINILWATMAAMRRALEGLSESIDCAIIDGDRVPHSLPCPAESIVKGDAKHPSISAASILAKTERDLLMAEYANEFPDYAFERHFGYATPEHLAALARFGPCPIHRRSFSPVKEQVGQLCLMLES